MVVQKFPLYDILASQVRAEPREVNWSTYLSTITNLPESHKSVIYLLIHHHQYKTTSKQKTIPYGGKTTFGFGYTVEFQKLPREIQEILYLYITLVTS